MENRIRWLSEGSRKWQQKSGRCGNDNFEAVMWRIIADVLYSSLVPSFAY